MVMNVLKQSTKFIKPHIPTPQTHRVHKFGFIDEIAGFFNVPIVLFFSPNFNHGNQKSVIDQLEKSLEKTLTRLYPLAGRYVDETQIIDCNDEGAEFIHASVNIKLEQVVKSDSDPKLVEKFVSLKSPVTFQLTHPLLLSIQVTKFECGGVAIGVTMNHKIGDVSTLCTFLNEWATINRKENNMIGFTGSGFNSSLVFPGLGLRTNQLPYASDDMLSKFTRKKVSFSESEILNIREHFVRASGKNSTRTWSKVQLAEAILSKAFIYVDRAIHKYSRDSLVIQSISLRGRFASLVPKDSCGNLSGLIYTPILGTPEITTLELANSLSDSIKKVVNNYSKVFHDSEEGKSMVLDSYSHLKTLSESTNLICLASWCNFSFYEANFGFGKPIWLAPVAVSQQNLVCLIDDAGGNGVEAHVCLEIKDVRSFEEAVDKIKDGFGTGIVPEKPKIETVKNRNLKSKI